MLLHVFPLVLFVLHVVLVAGQPEPCDLKPVPECTCWHTFGDITVSCNHVGLTEVPNLKSNSPHLRLDKLELAHNNITSIGPKDLIGTEVRHLVLSHNQIRHIDEDAFKDMMYTLQTLDLSHNELSAIPHFPDDAVLTSIDLRENKIRKLPHVFKQVPPGIKHIDMAENAIEPFQETVDGDFVPLPLESLSFGPVSKFEFENLFVIKNRLLKKLHIVDTKIEIKQDTNVLRKMGRVEELRLENCDVYPKYNMKYLFLALAPRLKVLSLPNNNLQEVPDMLHKLTKLHSLDLSNNRIRSLLLADLSELVNLQYLHLENNLIADVNAYVFAFMKNIRHIDLSGNKLESLSVDAFDVKRLLYIEVLLSDNPWRCDCDIAWLIEATKEELEGNPGPLQVNEIHYALKCAQPSELKDIRFSELATLYYDDFMYDCQY